MSSKAYFEQYRKKNRKRIRAYHKHWRDTHPANMQAHQRTNVRWARTFEGRYRRMVGNAQQRAKKAGIPCSITAADLCRLHKQQHGRCALSGIEFTLEFSGTRKATPFNSSLDKIKPARGYVPGNVRLLCQWVNVMRYDQSDADLRALCRKLVSFPHAQHGGRKSGPQL